MQNHVKKQMRCSAENSNRDVEQAANAGVMTAVISTAWSGSGVSGKVWELRERFLKEEKDYNWSQEKARWLETTGFTWGNCEQFDIIEVGVQRNGSVRLKRGGARSGSCAMLIRSSNLIFASTRDH